MKEERHYLDTPQGFFIDKMRDKIDKGVWNLYGESTSNVLKRILQLGYYTPNQKEWLRTMREDYIKSFCI